MSYLSWHWRMMQNLKKNWLVAWKMTWGILQIFTRELESVKIGTLIRSFCRKWRVENVWASNLQWSCVSRQWRVTQKFKRNWLVVLKLTWTSQILPEHSKSLKKIFVLIGSLWPKYILFELQKYRGVIFYDTEDPLIKKLNDINQCLTDPANRCLIDV